MTVTLGTPLQSSACRVLMLGSGELGKEVVIALQQFGVEVFNIDRYANAPAMQVAHHSRVLDMANQEQLRALIDEVKPHFVVPEIEAVPMMCFFKLNQVDKLWSFLQQKPRAFNHEP